jgi:hypothetical protein
MRRNLKMPGTNISQTDTIITNIEKDGFWLLTSEGEYFVSFAYYADFQNATVAQIHNFQSSPDGFHWPDLDIDIELDALKCPERYPKTFRRQRLSFDAHAGN